MRPHVRQGLIFVAVSAAIGVGIFIADGLIPVGQERERSSTVTPAREGRPSPKSQRDQESYHPNDGSIAAGDQGEGNYEAQAKAQDFIAEWAQVNSLPPDQALEWLGAHYADQVDFFGKQTSRDEILVQKRAFLQRWPTRIYAVVPPIDIHCVSVSCEVRGTMRFHAESTSAGRVSQGRASFELGLKFVNDELAIVYENSRVLSRH